MKTLILFILVAASVSGMAQEMLRLEESRQKAKANFPLLQQSDLLRGIAALKNENFATNYLPSVELKGQATYQSEVIELNIPVPGFEFEPVSKDQYKIYLDVRQNIWDGGVSKSMQAIENATLNTSLQKLEVQAFQVNALVDAYFFNILMVDKNLDILLQQKELLMAQEENIQNAEKYGAARKKDLLKLKAEMVSIDQTLIELHHKREMLVNLLAILIGEDLKANVALELPDDDTGLFITRPELEYFALQQEQMEVGNQMLNASRNPKLFGFAQAGYGKPGFNMLKNEFDPYYMVGLGLNWKVFDWKKTKRNKEINVLNKQMVDVMRDDFIRKQSLQLAEAQSRIQLFEEQIEEDENLLSLRQQVLEVANSELKNGSITATDFLMDFNTEALAKIKHEMHKLQLVQARVAYNRILGKE